ncbi:MAG: YkgJ family cysteine cluster protein, partial [Candidatus Omnitrophica bacterium]|nr:YkgJ family cysteine cluster protein [Candidatus Omnitrophota bacterium]
CHGMHVCTFFHSDDSTCRIYHNRPFECRLYPFLLIRKGDDVAVGVHLSCPHVREKRHDEDFKSYIESLQEYFQQQEVIEFVQRNQALPGNYFGYEQEVECLFQLPC